MKNARMLQSVTRDDSSPSPLLLDLAICLAVLILRERSFEHEPTDVVAALKIRLPLHQFLLLKVRSDVRHLDVANLRIQLGLIHLHNTFSRTTAISRLAEI